MYSKDILIGIMLSSAKPEIQIVRDDNAGIGYRVRLKVNLRGENLFLMAVRRTLYQHEISCALYSVESKARPKPILRVGGIKNIYKLSQMLDLGLHDRTNTWPLFREAVNIVSNGEHLTSEGLDSLFNLKGLI